MFKLDSPKGSAWLELIGSFRFEPSGDNKPYTVRKEGGAYWYGCRKVAGKVRKKYIGKSSEVSIARLEEIAEALEIPPVPRTDKVAEVAEQVAEVAEDRLTALESQVAELLKAVKDLQEALPGKSEAGDSLELPKVDNEVAERLQNELRNLRNENEALRVENGKIKRQYFDLLATSADVVNELNQESTKELRSQLEQEKADREEAEKKLEELQENSDIDFDFAGKAGELVSWLRKTAGKSLPKQVTVKEIQKILEGKDN